MTLQITYHEDRAVISGMISMGPFHFSVSKILAEEVEKLQARLQQAERRLLETERSIKELGP